MRLLLGGLRGLAYLPIIIEEQTFLLVLLFIYDICAGWLQSSLTWSGSAMGIAISAFASTEFLNESFFISLFGRRTCLYAQSVNSHLIQSNHTEVHYADFGNVFRRSAQTMPGLRCRRLLNWRSNWGLKLRTSPAPVVPAASPSRPLNSHQR